MNINYKQILTYFSSIAYHHEQINSFGFGDITQCTNDVETKQEPNYTRMYIVPDKVTLNQNHIHYNFNVIIMDLVDDDMSNLEEVMSDTLEIAQDIWTIFWQSYTNQSGNFSNIIVGDWSPEIVPFQERFQTIVAGWTMQISMSAPFDYNTCDLPIQGDYSFPQDESFSSYYQIIEDFKNFSKAHYQIKSFGFGDIYQLTNNIETKQEPLYPRIYFVPQPTRFDENHMHITWNIVIADIVDDNLANQAEILSDTLEIAKDFYSKAYLSDYETDWDATLQPWLEQTETILAGWSFTLSITQKFDFNRCVIPTTSFDRALTWEELDRLWKEVEQKWKNVKKLN